MNSEKDFDIDGYLYLLDSLRDMRCKMGIKEKVVLTESEYKKIMVNLAFNKSGDIGEGAKVIKYIQHLESENKKLRCCGNCAYWADSINGWYCTHSKKDTSKIDFRNSRCGNWSEVVGL